MGSGGAPWAVAKKARPMKSTELADRLIAELEAHGVMEHWLKDGRKHSRLYWRRDGRVRFFVFPKTPSDRRGYQNSLCDLRKVLGVRRTIRKANGKHPRKPRERRTEATPCPALSGGGDPFAPLAALLSPEQAAFVRLTHRTELALYRLSFFAGSFEAWKRSNVQPSS